MDNSTNGTGRDFMTIALSIVALLVIVGAAWYFVQTNSTGNQYDNSVSETENTEPQQKVSEDETVIRRSGTFVGVEPKIGSGSVSLVNFSQVTDTVIFEDNFSVQEGPDLFVAFGNAGTVDLDTLFAELQSFNGRQEYKVPNTIDTSKYSQVFIYCKEFSANFAVADLN